MSLESSIATLIQRAGDLMALPQQLYDTAAARILAIGNAYQALQTSGIATFYVNAVTGDDAAAGTAGAPLKTIGKALMLTPFGGVCSVYLQADYLSAEKIFVNGRRLKLYSADTVKYALSFNRYQDVVGAVTYRSLAGFKVANGGSVHVSGLKLVVPPLDGTWGNYTTRPSSVLFEGVGDSQSSVMVSLTSCDIDMPATPFASLFTTLPVTLHVYSLTETNATMKGKVIETITAAGGTDPATKSFITTNLALI